MKNQTFLLSNSPLCQAFSVPEIWFQRNVEDECLARISNENAGMSVILSEGRGLELSEIFSEGVSFMISVHSYTLYTFRRGYILSSNHKFSLQIFKNLIDLQILSTSSKNFVDPTFLAIPSEQLAHFPNRFVLLVFT